MSITSFTAAQLVRALPRVALSRAVGKLCEAPLSPPVAGLVQKLYCSLYPVKLEEASDEGPYASFDAFFTRSLKPGMRPVSEDRLVSPADGELSSQGKINAECRILVKDQPYQVAELLGDPQEAKRYKGGSFAVVYLSPSDYHRVHSPVDGSIPWVRGIPGDLYPVNSLGERYVDGLFVRNNRVVVPIDTLNLGRVTVILVGATIVGRISVSAIAEPAVPAGDTVLEPPSAIERGQELGMFHLGSTAVLLLEPGVELQRKNGVIRYGESLLRPA